MKDNCVRLARVHCAKLLILFGLVPFRLMSGAEIGNTGWSHDLIGNASLSSSSLTGDSLSVSVLADGFDGAGDDVVFVHKELPEEGSVECVLTIPTQGQQGVMVRDSLSSDGAFLFAGVDASGGVQVHARIANSVQSIESRSASGTGVSRLRIEWRDGYAFVIALDSVGAETYLWGIDLPPSNATMAGACVLGSGSFSVSLDEADLAVEDFTADQSASWVVLSEPWHLDTQNPDFETGVLSREKWQWGPSSVIPDLGSSWEVDSVLGFSSGDVEQLISTGASNPEVIWAWQFESDVELGNYSASMAGETYRVYGRWRRAADLTNSASLTVKVSQWEIDASSVNAELTQVVDVKEEGDLWVYLGDLSFSGTEYSGYVECAFNWGAVPADAVSIDGIMLVSPGVRPGTDLNNDGLDDALLAVIDGYYTSLGAPLDTTIQKFGDYDGDGLSNQDELWLLDPAWELGAGLYGFSSAPEIQRATGYMGSDSDPDSPVAYNHWSRKPFAVQVYRSETGRPVAGYPVIFREEFRNWVENTPFVNSGFGDTVEKVHQAITNLEGVSLASYWAGSAYTSPGSHTWNLAAANGVGESAEVLWTLRPYQNHSPGPIDLSVGNVTFSSIPSGQLTTTSPGPLSGITGGLAFGPWLVLANYTSSGPTGSPNGSGYLEVRKWDSALGEFSPFGEILPPGGGSTNGRLGECLAVSHSGVLAVSERGAQKVHLFQLDPYGTGFDASPFHTFTGIAAVSVAVSNNNVAVGTSGTGDGGVKIFSRDSGETSGWSSTAQTLLPSSGDHSDRFGSALAFSESGNVLAVGAPSDMWWYSDPSSQGYEETTWIEESYDVYDEENNYLYTEYYSYESTEWVSYPPPADPSVYFYDVTPAASPPCTFVEREFPTSFAMNSFGMSVAFLDEQLYVGAPGVGDYSGEYAPAGYVESFVENSGGEWDRVAVVTRGNPNFGVELSSSREVVFAHAGDGWETWSDPEPMYPEMMSVMVNSTSGVDVIHDAHFAADGITNASRVFADDDTVFLSRGLGSGTSITWHRLIPSIPGNLTTGSTAVSVVANDADLSNPDAEETLLVRLYDNGVTGLEVGQPTQDSLVVSDSSILASKQGSIVPLTLEVEDAVGDRYFEAFTLRITGPVPGSPTMGSPFEAGLDRVEVPWTASSNVGAVSAYSVQSADLDAYDTAVATNDPLEVDAVFSEIARVSPSRRVILDRVPFSQSGVAYRAVAHNKDGDSIPSAVEIRDFDSDEDGIPDWWEALFGLDLSSTGDADSDGWTDLEEWTYGTNPLIGDTDGDGIEDDLDDFPLDGNYNPAQLVLNTALE